MNTPQKALGKYVLCYVNLSYLFDAAEMVFLLHMVDIENMKRNGYNTVWSKDFMLVKMGIGVRLFDRCTRRLTSMGLVSRKLIGNKYSYSLDLELYERLVRILSVTNDANKLKKFCEVVFLKEKRSIRSLSEEEIRKLEGKQSQ